MNRAWQQAMIVAMPMTPSFWLVLKKYDHNQQRNFKCSQALVGVQPGPCADAAPTMIFSRFEDSYFTRLLPLTRYHPQFFTATVYQWKRLLKPETYKQIITSSLGFLSEQKRVKVFAFAIMNNHIHIIWQMQQLHKREDVQQDFLKYTDQQMISDLGKHHPDVLKIFEVTEKDRKYRVWQRNALSTDLFTHFVFMQKA